MSVAALAIAMTNEKEREAHVYLAKVAEQAERYEGTLSLSRLFLLALLILPASSSVQITRRSLVSSMLFLN